MAHLVGHGGGHEAGDLAVPHAHPARELVGAYRTFQSLANHTRVKLKSSQQLGIVIGKLFDKSFSSIMEEICEGCIRIGAERYLIVFRPHVHAHESNVDVEWSIQSVGNICNVFALAINFLQIPSVFFVFAIIHDNYQLDESGSLVGVPWTFHINLVILGSFILARRNVTLVSQYSVKRGIFEK